MGIVLVVSFCKNTPPIEKRLNNIKEINLKEDVLCNILHKVIIMAKYLVNLLADMLTKGDTYDLFKLLRERYNSISEICKRIGIERETFYHWRHAKQINIETKRKILSAVLDEYPVNTLEFLARKLRERSIGTLSLLFEVLCREIKAENDREKLRKLVKRSKGIIEEFSVPLTEYLNHEIYAFSRDY